MKKYEIHFEPFFANKKAGLLKSGLKHSVIERKLFRFPSKQQQFPESLFFRLGNTSKRYLG